MKQNPFSLYDFLGYVFPGALALMLIAFFYQLDLQANPNLSMVFDKATAYIKNQNNTGNLGIVEETVILTIAAYVIGHIVAYLSSLTVEKFSIWTYGYPSEFLLGTVKPFEYIVGPWKNNLKNWNELKPLKRIKVVWALIMEYIWRIIIAVFLMPISLTTLLLGYLLRMNVFLLKPLDGILTSTISNNIDKLKQSLGISSDKRGDFHRIIYHYEYEHQPNHVTKLDNYVALYGFLRALTFIANCTTIWIMFKYVFPTMKKGGEADWHLILLCAVCVLVTYIFFMAFMKFYRRFTLEGLMCLVIDDSFKDVPKVACEFIPTHSSSTIRVDDHTLNLHAANNPSVTMTNSEVQVDTSQVVSTENGQ